MNKRSNKRIRDRQMEIKESCAGLRNLLGDDNKVPSSISFSDEKSSLVQIDTNAYELSFRGESSIFQYDVSLEPEILSSKMVTHFLYTALCCPEGGVPMGENEKWQKIIFDGQRIIYSPESGLDGTYTVQPRKDQEKVITITVRQTREIKSDDSESLLSIYNTAFHKAYHALHLSNFRRKWIDESSGANSGSFRIYSGFLPSVSYLSHGLSYVLNTATRIDRIGTLYDYMNSKQVLEDRDKRPEFLESLKSLQIQTIHRPKKPRTVIISSILWDYTADSKSFERVNPKTHEKSSITFAQYYRDVYNHTCKPNDVLVEMVTRAQGQDKVTIFPSSVLKISGITDKERAQRDIMKDIASHTRMKSNDRKKKLDEFIGNLKTNSEASSFLKQWGFGLGPSIQIAGHVINPPAIEVSKKNGGARETYPLNDKLQYQIWKDHAMYQGATIKNALLIVAPEKNRNDIPNFINSLQKVSPGIGLTLPQINPSEHVLYVENTHPNEYCNVIARYFERCPQDQIPTFVICLISNNKKERYNGIKHFLTVELGVLSQCVVTQKLFSNNQRGGGLSVYTNIAIQIASKLGGVPAKVKIPVTKTMVVGLSLPSSSLRGTSPVCAGTCSTDRELIHFYTSMKSLQRGENVIPEDFINEFLEEGLKKFKEDNGYYPKNIVVYRDGVTYAQMPNLKNVEVKAIVDVVKRVTENEEGEETSVVYMVAQKHASIRIMKKNGNEVGEAGAGTVIVDGIGAKGVAEFYMISHYANQGTAAPTRYTIIYEYPKYFKDEQLIKLTHFQTLQYPNWSGSIRMPACLMLASRLAEMAKTHLSSDSPKEYLNSKLHFL